MKLYLKTYSDLCRDLDVEKPKKDDDKVVLSKTAFDAIVRALLEKTLINEETYQSLYPDVEEWVSSNEGVTAHQHFVQTGFFEDRFLIPAEFEEITYLRANLDIAIAVKKGVFETGLSHYLLFGHDQKRRLV